MKGSKVLFQITIPLLLVVLASTSCTLEIIDLQATRAASATRAAGVTPTVTPLPPMEVALQTFHGRHVTAMGEEDGWVLRQETELTECGWFTQHHLANGRIALVTCHGRYVNAPKDGTTRWDWFLGQESQLSDCGQFELYDLGSDRVAFRTCAGRFFTAGDDGWEPPWSVGAATDILLDWEIFAVLQQ